MDRITELEGVEYFFNHAEEAGVILPSDYSSVDFCAIHTNCDWRNTKKEILENIIYREMVGDFKLIKTTKMKNGLFNHVFEVDY